MFQLCISLLLTELPSGLAEGRGKGTSFGFACPPPCCPLAAGCREARRGGRHWGALERFPQNPRRFHPAPLTALVPGSPSRAEELSAATPGW